jgi:hypothetical protein
MDNLNNLVTPDDYISFYYNELKKEFDSQNIQLSKVGFVGFLFNLLGNTQYDVKHYYDNLFKEAFPITSLNNKNLKYHGNVFGYSAELGKYSTLSGVFKFNLESLPALYPDIVKREIILENIKVQIDELEYNLISKYRLVLNQINGSISGFGEITFSDGKQKLIPIQYLDINLPIYELNQYKVETITFVSPNYVYRTFYSYPIKIDDGEFLTNLDVGIIINNQKQSFAAQTDKNKYSSSDQVIFYEVTPDNYLNIELGSGENGVYIPNTKVYITKYTTKGTLGNIGSKSTTNITGDINIIDYDINNNSTEQFNPIQLNQLITTNIDKGYGGKDPLSGENLRNDLISYIQSRNNFCSETDYRYILKDYFDDFEILFKKSKLQENIFYIYLYLKDRFNNPVYSITSTVSEQQFILNKFGNNIFYPEFEIETEQFISPFLYIYDPILNIYNGYIVKKNPVFYSSSISNVITTSENPPIIFLELAYNQNNTIIYLKSYQDLTNYNFDFTSIDLKIQDQLLVRSNIDNSIFSIIIPGIIKDKIDIEISVYPTSTNVELFKIKFTDVKQVEDFSDLIKLKTFTKPDGIKYILNLSLIHKETFLSDENYYLDKLINTFSNININNNRMISDEISIKLLNTFNVNGENLRKITLQNHNLNSREVTELNVIKDTNGNLSGKYFTLSSLDVDYYLWFYIDELNSQDPNLVNKIGIKCEIEKNNSIEFVRSAIVTTLNLVNAFSSEIDLIDNDTLKIYNTEGGVLKNHLNVGNTGFNSLILQYGDNVSLKFPLKLKIDIIADKLVVVSNGINMNSEIDKIKVSIAEYLLKDKTKIYQRFYSSEIIDMLQSKPFVKYVSCTITDKSDSVIPGSNIEIYPYYDIEKKLDKYQLLDFSPHLFWWDVNNLIVNYKYN